MTVRTAWLVNDSMSGEDIRLAQTATVVHDNAIRARGGVVPSPSSPLNVTFNSGMGINVAAGQAVIGGQRAGAQGTYVVTNDATLGITLANGDPAQPRTDAIVAYVRDTVYSDTTQVGGIGVVQGTPGVSFPVPTYSGTSTLGTAVLLGTVKVPANASAGGGGLVSAGAVFTDTRPFASSIGGRLIITSAAEEAALSPYSGLSIVRTDIWQMKDYLNGGWAVTGGRFVRGWDNIRSTSPTSIDSYPSGSFTPLLTVSLPSTAPAGRYEVAVSLPLYCSVTSAGYLRVLAGATNISYDTRFDVQTLLVTQNWVRTYVHSGGALTFAASHQALAGTVSVANSGAILTVKYIGPE